MQFARGRERTRSAIKHLIAVYIFLFYLMCVYRLTGLVGFVWWLRSPLISLDRIGLIPFAASGSIVPELLNILMTIPFGFLLPAIWSELRSLKKIILAGFFLSLTIETMQLFTFRFSTTGDLITNTLGAVIGYLIFVVLFRLFRRTKNNAQSTHQGMRYEALVYIALSLIGAIFLHHPAIEARLPAPEISIGSIEIGINPERSEGMEYARVIVTEISDDENSSALTIQAEVLYRQPAETLDLAALTFTVTDSTAVLISTGHGQNHSFTPGTIDDISPSALLDVFGYQDGDMFFAMEIVMTRDE